MGIVDTMMVGTLGPQSLAAVGMGRTVLMAVLIFILAVSTGSQVLVARYTGSGDEKEVTKVVDQSLILDVLMSIVLTIVGLLLSPFLLKILGAESEVVALGIPYIRIVFLGLIFMLSNFIINSILQGAGDTRTPLKIMLLINILNIMFNYFLIFGIGFFPQLGIQGAAWATVLSRIVGASIGVWVLKSGRFAARTDIFSCFELKKELMYKIVRIGLPAGLQGLVRAGTGMVTLWFVANTVYATYAVAAFTIGLQVEAISFMPGLAFGTGAATLVSQNIGARKVERAKKSGVAAAAMAALMMSVVGFAFYIFARQIIAMFTENAAVLDVGAQYLRIMLYSQPFLALAMVFSGALRGGGDTKTPLVYSMIHSWLIRIPLIYALGFVLDFQADGIWWAINIATATQGLATWWKFHKGHWQEIKL